MPEDIASDLAQDQSIGHRIGLPTEGTLTVNAQQGSGKTLAAHRLYQLALQNRLEDHSQPLPVCLNARNIIRDLKDEVEGCTREHGSVYTQKVLVIIDGLDETGRQKANQLLIQAQSYTDANQNVATVVISRPLPGLNTKNETYTLPECDEEGFLSIVSGVAGREVNQFEIPFREYRTRLPLFATIIGAYLRKPLPIQGRTASQIVSEIAQQVLSDSLDDRGDTEELLKKLAVASITSGESVEKRLVSPKTSDQARMANSRIVSEQGGKFDFTLAIFREWFAAKAIVERTVSIDDIELNSDRWVTPLAIAINSENPHAGPEIMAKLSSTDPGMAGLVLEEIKHNWSVEEPAVPAPLGPAMETGNSIRNAMENWKTGLGLLMSALKVLDQSGNLPTLGIEVRPGRLTTSWYRGDETLAPVVQLPEGLNDPSRRHFWNWPRWKDRGIEPTRTWPWQITHEDLSDLLAKELKTLQFARATRDGFHEFAHAFTNHLRWTDSRARNLKTSAEVIDYIDKLLSELRRDSIGSVTFGRGEYIWTVPELELFRGQIFDLVSDGTAILEEPWPEPDKEPPSGRTSWIWFETYTEERLLQRTNAIFNGALRIYNEIVDQWLPTFNRRNQMTYALPFRLHGELRLPPALEENRWNSATLIYWPVWANDTNDSGVFLELGPKERAAGQDTQKKILAAQEQFLEQGRSYFDGWTLLSGNEPRPATKLANQWLRSDLNALHWANR